MKEEILPYVQSEHLVIDVGCGSLARVFPVMPYARQIVGIDISRSQLKLAKQTLAHAEFDNQQAGKVDIVLGDITHLPFRKSVFAVALCWDVMEHVSDLEGALQEISAIQVLGGFLFVRTSNILNPLIFLSKIESLLPKGWRRALEHRFKIDTFDRYYKANLPWVLQKSMRAEGYDALQLRHWQSDYPIAPTLGEIFIVAIEEIFHKTFGRRTLSMDMTVRGQKLGQD